MARYVAFRPKAWVSATHTPEQQPTCTVHVADKEPIRIGLWDAAGVPLYRVEDTVPLGFVGRAKKETKP